MFSVETYSLTCPWCGSLTEVTLDCSAGNQELVEDCIICCGPMLVTMSCDPFTGRIINVSAARENE